MGVAEVQGAEDDHGRDDQEAEYQMQKKDDLVEVVLQRLSGPPFEPSDRSEVDRVDGEQGEQREYDEQQFSQPRPYRGDVSDPGAGRRIFRDGFLRSHRPSVPRRSACCTGC